MDYDLDTLHNTFMTHAEEYKMHSPKEFNLPFAMAVIIQELQALRRDLDRVYTWVLDDIERRSIERRCHERDDTGRDGQEISTHRDTQPISNQRDGDNTSPLTGLSTTMDGG